MFEDITNASALSKKTTFSNITQKTQEKRLKKANCSN